MTTLNDRQRTARDRMRQQRWTAAAEAADDKGSFNFFEKPLDVVICRLVDCVGRVGCGGE